MCDGTPCPCNILPRTDPASKYYGKPPTVTRVRRGAAQVALYGSGAVVLWALLITLTGMHVFDILGPVTIGVVLAAVLTAAVAGAFELGPRIAAQHRYAVRQVRK